AMTGARRALDGAVREAAAGVGLTAQPGHPAVVAALAFGEDPDSADLQVASREIDRPPSVAQHDGAVVDRDAAELGAGESCACGFVECFRSQSGRRDGAG